MDPLSNTFAPVAVQAVGTLVVAALLRPLIRLTPGRFLAYWWAAWLALSVALGSLYAADHLPGVRAPLLVGYCLAEYLFAFLVWAGCRELATGEPLGPWDWVAVAPLLVPGVAAPLSAPDLWSVFPVHAAFAGFLYVRAVWALWGYRPGPGASKRGVWAVRASLGGLAVLFWHAAIVAGYGPAGPGTPDPAFWYMYDLFLDTGLAFGMVVLASDRLRQELEERNQRLAAATDELHRAARTDPLTGLFNRRALDALAADPPAGPFGGCLAVLDMNDLKALNDRYGHATGDAALRLIARAVQAVFRVTDPVFRLGGDEFLVVLLNGTEADLCDRLGRIEIGLTAQRLPGAAGPVDVRVAWGVSGFDGAADLWPAVDRADAAMYCRKKRQKQAAAGV